MCGAEKNSIVETEKPTAVPDKTCLTRLCTNGIIKMEETTLWNAFLVVIS